MRKHLKNAFDQIDAGFFFSDAFDNDSDAIEEAEQYLARWTRAVARIRALNKERNIDDVGAF